MRYFLVAFIILINGSLTICFSQDTDPHPKNYEGFISLNANFIPHQDFTITPIAGFSANHFYSELRYNYEDLNTLSLALGYKFGKDDTLFWYDVIPMIGGSVGHFDAISPELAFDIGLGPLTFSIDAEYSFALDTSHANYFFTWAELSFDISPSVYAGISVQHSQVFQTSSGVDVGFVLGYNPGAFGISASASNIWNSSRYFILGVSYSFQHAHNARRGGTSPLK